MTGGPAGTRSGIHALQRAVALARGELRASARSTRRGATEHAVAAARAATRAAEPQGLLSALEVASRCAGRLDAPVLLEPRSTAGPQPDPLDRTAPRGAPSWRGRSTARPRPDPLEAARGVDLLSRALAELRSELTQRAGTSAGQEALDRDGAREEAQRARFEAEARRLRHLA